MADDYNNSSTLGLTFESTQYGYSNNASSVTEEGYPLAQTQPLTAIEEGINNLEGMVNFDHMHAYEHFPERPPPDIRVDTTMSGSSYRGGPFYSPETPHTPSQYSATMSPMSNTLSSPTRSGPVTPANQQSQGLYPPSFAVASPNNTYQADYNHNMYNMHHNVKQESSSPYLTHPGRLRSASDASSSSFHRYSSYSSASASPYHGPAPAFPPSSPVAARGATYFSRDMAPGRGRMIPQSKYRPHTAADRDRYVNKIQLHEPVHFNTTDPAVVGITLSDALAGKYQQLDGRDDRLFLQCGPSISIRINWAGCYPPWSRQIPTRDFKNPPGPVTRSKVAKNVARSVQRFIDEMNNKALEDDADPSWAVGRVRNGIVLEDLALVRLEHVSKGSWQAHLCFASASIEKGPL